MKTSLSITLSLLSDVPLLDGETVKCSVTGSGPSLSRGHLDEPAFLQHKFCSASEI